MKMLKHYNWTHTISFNDGSITSLIIENPITYRKYILELLEQIDGKDGDFIFSENNKELTISKKLAIITDPINLVFDEKKINTKINKDIVSLAQTNPFIQKELYPLVSILEKYADLITEEYGYNISYDQIETSSLIKMLSFHINTEYNSPASKILEWLNITHDILEIEDFVITNLSIYFTEEEIQTLCNEASSLKHNLLLIDSQKKLNFDNTIIIDSDNCELYNSPIL